MNLNERFEAHLIQLIEEILPQKYLLKFNDSCLEINCADGSQEIIKIPIRVRQLKSEDYRESLLSEIIYLISSLNSIEFSSMHSELNETRLFISHFNDRMIIYGLYPEGKCHIVDLMLS
jgi:hypothetical protein